MVDFKRVFLIVLDSVGIGEAPDAALYNDEGADTLGHIAEYVNGLNMPNFGELGISHIREIKGISKVDSPAAHYTKMQEASEGKDTMTGHWELMGLKVEQPFQTFPNGFPKQLIQQVEQKTGRPVIGNKVASGTEIIEELGAQHMETGSLIVYTSADSVFQIAAHEDIIPIDELYDICETVRALTLQPEYLVGRVIARPFIGSVGSFERTANRHDYALKPFAETVLNTLEDRGLDVIGIGKISDIFNGEGITQSIRTKDNVDGLKQIINVMEESFEGLAFLNLVDFDAKYGHRRDPKGYADALETFDRYIPKIIEHMKEGDLLIFTADHGNDPTHHGTDHTREFVPLLVYHRNIEKGRQLPIRETFADVGATIADNFNVPLPKHGHSFLAEIK